MLTSFILSFAEAKKYFEPLSFFIIAITIYSFFTFKFYRFLAKKDVFNFKLYRLARKGHYKIRIVLKALLYLIEYFALLPFFAFFWLTFITIILLFMAPSQTTSTILMFSVGLIIATRIASYYDEDLSKDLAKTLPFSLLVLLLIDLDKISSFSLMKVQSNVYLLWKPIIYYIILIILIEFILRTAFLIGKVNSILKSYKKKT
jgi:hypothetical protein